MPRTDIVYGYAGIRVRNLARSLKFYRGLGFRLYRRGKMEHGGQWVQLTGPGRHQRLELNYYAPGNRFCEPYRAGSELDHLGFFVKNVDRWVKRAEKLGGKLAVDFSETRERLAYVKDPDGVWVEFCGAPAKPRKRSSATA